MADLKKDIGSQRRKASVLRALLGGIEDLADAAGQLRYGVRTSRKEALARARSLPGAPTPDEDAEEADRYAAGYLFAKKYPRFSSAFQPLVSRLKVSDTPILGGSSPELQSYADAGATAGRRAAYEDEESEE